MPNQKEDAELLRFQLILGEADVGDVVTWADSVILADPKPDIAVIEVSLGLERTPKETVTLLRDVSGSADRTAPVRRWMRSALKRLDEDSSAAEAIARRLYRLFSAGEIDPAVFGYEPSSLDDTFYLVRCNIHGTREDAIAELREYLARSTSHA